jgi:phage tail-like protein
MDANQLRFWMIANEADWQLGNNVAYNAQSRRLKLASQFAVAQFGPLPVGLRGQALARLQIIPQTIDAFETRAYWQHSSARIMATGVTEASVPIFRTPADTPPTDIAIGQDGVLYIAHEGVVYLHDLRERWSPVRLVLPGFSAWRLAPCGSGGVYVLDNTNNQLAYVQGRPLPQRPYAPPAATTARPCEESPDPPRISLLSEAGWSADESAVALACAPNGTLAVLLWQADGQAVARLLLAEGSLSDPTVLAGAFFPYSIAWLAETHIALRLVQHPTEVLSYAFKAGDASSQPSGEFYPLRDPADGPFLNSLSPRPYYPISKGAKALYPISLQRYARRGTARNHYTLDSGNIQTVWHRMYAEALIPPNCAFTVFLAATNTAAAPEDEDDNWFPHDFGQKNSGDFTPLAAWESLPSEIPLHPGFLENCLPERDRAGLFTVLIQRDDRMVKSLRGRYLHLRVELLSDGDGSPEIAALRVYGSRFSYVENYLPQVYHETRFGKEADSPATSSVRSTPPDFLERFVNIFESVLTPLEGRIASSYLLTDPAATPDDALEWLGLWLGLGFDPDMPEAIRRRLLSEAPELYRRWGTFLGLKHALDILTDDAVSNGEIVILEDWRLRRTFSTILGANLANEEDPLLAGISRSGNSFVGDTLFLGDEFHKEFLALFAADLPTSRYETAQINRFLDALAYRVTVLVHQDKTPLDLRLIRRIVNLAVPAHVEAKVLTSTRRFIVGLASLVGVDTYVGEEVPREPVQVNKSFIGKKDFIQGVPSLDPRLGRGSSGPASMTDQPPVARLSAPENAELGQNIRLDASASSASPGRIITDYDWTYTNNDEI